MQVEEGAICVWAIRVPCFHSTRTCSGGRFTLRSAGLVAPVHGLWGARRSLTLGSDLTGPGSAKETDGIFPPTRRRCVRGAGGAVMRTLSLDLRRVPQKSPVSSLRKLKAGGRRAAPATWRVGITFARAPSATHLHREARARPVRPLSPYHDKGHQRSRADSDETECETFQKGRRPL